MKSETAVNIVHLFSLLFDVPILHLALEVYTEFGTVSDKMYHVKVDREHRQNAGAFLYPLGKKLQLFPL